MYLIMSAFTPSLSARRNRSNASCHLIDGNTRKERQDRTGQDRAGHRTQGRACLLYTSPSPRDKRQSRMPSSA